MYWQLDHSMWLHPAPDVLVLCDRQPQFQHTYEETIGINPGAFASDLSWFVYRPRRGRPAQPRDRLMAPRGGRGWKAGRYQGKGERCVRARARVRSGSVRT